jgi:Anaerobic dehydrogenases, typically selenocysteine-containing
LRRMSRQAKSHEQEGMTPVSASNGEWQPTACILCECNCGIEVRLGGEDGRTFERIRGDKAHPASQGYTCEKALRLDHYQNGRAGRVLSPLRRRPDGTFEEIDWDTAIAEVAEKLAAVRPTAASRSSTTAAAGRGTTWGAPTVPPPSGPWAPGSAPAPWPRRRRASSGSTT